MGTRSPGSAGRRGRGGGGRPPHNATSRSSPLCDGRRGRTTKCPSAVPCPRPSPLPLPWPFDSLPGEQEDRPVVAEGHARHFVLPVLVVALVTSPQSSLCVSHAGQSVRGDSPWGTLILLSRGRGQAEPRCVPVSAHSALRCRRLAKTLGTAPLETRPCGLSTRTGLREPRKGQGALRPRGDRGTVAPGAHSSASRRHS